MKPSFDKALCEGMNRLVWHAFVCSPDSTGVPGQQYFAGTHLNPKVTWWNMSAPFFGYINRCQWMLQQGRFVADALYYYGDGVPNFSQLKKSDPARVLPGFDYDVITEEALLTRTSVRNSRIVLPDGMNYRVLVLANHDVISLPVLEKIRGLVAAGATVIGPKPAKGETLQDYPACDGKIRKLADEVWADCDGIKVKERNFGKGRVFSGETARQVLQADGVSPDCQAERRTPARLDGERLHAEAVLGAPLDLDYIHRAAGNTDIYFVANRSTNAVSANCEFRVLGRVPELWNPVTGERKLATAYDNDGKTGRTIVPLDFAPCGSWFVVFRDSATRHPATAKSNSATLAVVLELAGPWMVHFDPKWGGPVAAEFERLVSWTARPEPGIKFYSGTASYEKTFSISDSAFRAPHSPLWLDLGNVRELAEVRVNGKSCGTSWSPPFRLDISFAVKPGMNKLEIAVVNFWPNRIIGDASLPPEQRLTQTNIRNLTANMPLMESGLFGPVQILRETSR